MEWIDISVPIKTGMVHWPGDAEVKISRIKDMEEGDKSNLSEICMGAHTGTHMDAPRHFFSDGAGIDRLPLDVVFGRARVIEIEDGQSINVAELQRHAIGRGERILFKTANSRREVMRSKQFVEDFVYVSMEAAGYLVERGVVFVGVDYLSVGGYKGKGNGSEVHKTLLGAGVWLLEGLDLSEISAGDYELVCLPLKIVDGDGAPARARAVVRPLAGSK